MKVAPLQKRGFHVSFCFHVYLTSLGEKKDGYSINVPSTLLVKIAPLLKLTVSFLKAAVVAGRSLGYPLPMCDIEVSVAMMLTLDRC